MSKSNIVLDASAVLAFVNQESGKEQVEQVGLELNLQIDIQTIR